MPAKSLVPIQTFFNQWKAYIQNVYRQKIGKIPTTAQTKPANKNNDTSVGNQNLLTRSSRTYNQLIWDKIIRSYSVKTLASELRRKAATQFGNQYGRRFLPTFAFGLAGLSLTNDGVKTEEILQESLSSDVRGIFNSRFGNGCSLLDKVQELSLDRFIFGSLIGQGCNAAVYEAKIKCGESGESDAGMETATDDDDIAVIEDNLDMSDLNKESSNEVTDYKFTIVHAPANQTNLYMESDDESDLNSIVVVCDDDTDTEIPDDGRQETNNKQEFDDKIEEFYPFAIKMMYNYDVESNADSILKVMAKETVPAKLPLMSDNRLLLWDNGNRVRLKSLPEHPNVVDMLGVFVDPVPALPDGIVQYPAALPQRLNPTGFGRNKTMFLVMKKYTKNLREYLETETPTILTRCLLLAQLLESVVHMVDHGIAHRDIKSDNILLDYDCLDAVPTLVLSDFGCCLADSNYGLKLPYPTIETDRGGNRSLMAPEIACRSPGPNVVLDYSKSDLWAVGTLVYEIFGMENPFYTGKNSKLKLDSAEYKEEDLPTNNNMVPGFVELLKSLILRRNPEQRLYPALAADLMQIWLWFPDWLSSGNKPSVSKITEEILILTVEILFQSCDREQHSLEVDAQLKLTFLRRVNINQIVQALEFYHSQFE